MTDLQEIKDAWAIEKVKPQDKQITHEQIDWLIAQVERLTAELDRERIDTGRKAYADGMERAAKFAECLPWQNHRLAAAIRADKERGDEKRPRRDQGEALLRRRVRQS